MNQANAGDGKMKTLIWDDDENDETTTFLVVRSRLSDASYEAAVWSDLMPETDW